MDMYRRLTHDLRANGCRVVGDLAGEALREALKGGLDVLKISHEEAAADGWAAGSDRSELLEGIARLQAAGARTVVLSRAEGPALAGADGHFWEIVAPVMEPADHRGPGDSMTAGLAAGLANGASAEQILRLGAAAGCLNATRHGLGTGTRSEIERLAGHVELRSVAPASP
jgi:1-phosphofructokinase